MPKYYITLQQRKQTNRRTSNRKYGKRRTVKFPHPVAESLMPRFYEPPAAAQSGGAWNMFGQHYAPIAPSNDSYETYKGSESSYMPNSIPNSTPNSIPNSMPSSMPSSSAMSSISYPSSASSGITSLATTTSTTYIVKYTKLDNGSVVNKEVFVQEPDTYKHYTIDEDNHPEPCWKEIPRGEFGQYINQPYNANNQYGQCGIDLRPLGKTSR
jgi:hypothetical protein